MPVELLSVCFPTRNRASFLQVVLDAFEAQIRKDNIPPEVVRLYVSDNTSTDQTPELIKAYASRLPHLVPSRNPENIGGDRNFLKCISLARGEYCWLVGDDDIINPGALQHVLQTLRAQKPALMINLETGYVPKVKRPTRFETFRDFVAECARTNPHLLAEHSLITCNVFRRTIFDLPFGEETLPTNFGHMYGLAKGLSKHGGAIYLSDFPAVSVRARRAAPVDGVWPGVIEKAWVDYINWVGKELNLPELSATAVVAHVDSALWQRIRRNPFKYAWDNLPSLVQPRAYIWFIKRLVSRSRLKKQTLKQKPEPRS